jgi:RimJ/RimL family protein N-acetyltransferase
VPALWPLFGLRLTTPRIELAPVCDDDLDELASLARRGIHSPDTAPFSNTWTDLVGTEFERGFAKYFWRQRAHWSPDAWRLPFAVRRKRRLLGIQQIEAKEFPVLRTVGTGSWLGGAFQGRGFGTEMRAAVLAFAFEGLGAAEAISAAYDYNAASISVSQKLGYEPNGVRTDNVRGEPATALLFRLTREQWHRTPRVLVAIDGLQPCADLFGAVEREPARQFKWTTVRPPASGNGKDSASARTASRAARESRRQV